MDAFALMMAGSAKAAAPKPKSGPRLKRLGDNAEPGRQLTNKKPRASGGVQMHLDLGQRDFSVSTCATCGMLYGRGLPEEERLHAAFHNAHAAAFRFPGWSSERVVARDGARGRLLLVAPGDPAPHMKKVAEVAARLEAALGLPEGHLTAPQPPCKVFLYVDNASKRVTGALVAQRQERAVEAWLGGGGGGGGSDRSKGGGGGSSGADRHGKRLDSSSSSISKLVGSGLRCGGGMHREWSSGGEASSQLPTQSSAPGLLAGDRVGQVSPSESALCEPDVAAASLPGVEAEAAVEAAKAAHGTGRGGAGAGAGRWRAALGDAGAEAGTGGGEGTAGGTSGRAGAAAGAAAGTQPGGSCSREGDATCGAPALAQGAGDAGRAVGGDGGGESLGGCRAAQGLRNAGRGVDRAAAAVSAAVPVAVGVRGLWVEPSSRRRGVARRLLDAARCFTLHGYVAERQQVAFSAVAVGALAGEEEAAFGAFAAACLGRRGGAGPREGAGEGAGKGQGGGAREVRVLLYEDGGEGVGTRSA